MRIAPEGRRLCIVLAVTAAGTAFAGLGWPAAILATAAVFCLNFFRDPPRVAPRQPDAFVSPADGKVVAVAPDDAALGEPGRRVSIFMSVFDVHVNRAPADGTVTAVTHHPGRFLNAMAGEASEHNEQTRISVQHERGPMVVKQIAGLVARRIICYCQPDRPVRRGDRIGLIRFGSRVDVIVPAACDIGVAVGQKVRAGESILGTWPPG